MFPRRAADFHVGSIDGLNNRAARIPDGKPDYTRTCEVCAAAAVPGPRVRAEVVFKWEAITFCPEIIVICLENDGSIKEYALNELLPYSFSEKF